ncbi:hypothetical protein [Bosea sp. BIWAKO-01]|uniref:hypothetical protein n=1 Tax=Bosea sp. BIWAKO-01 TaxID=506668 RepID=UPI000853DD92|nr:hypothetical protein [Bosea sp. BIWAKO-01]
MKAPGRGSAHEKSLSNAFERNTRRKPERGKISVSHPKADKGAKAGSCQENRQNGQTEHHRESGAAD